MEVAKEEAAQDIEMANSPADVPSGETTNGVGIAPTPSVEPSSSAPSAPSAQEVDLHPASMSQLAIESTENDSSSVPTTAEVSMTDAADPLPTVKVAREREEDDDDEPAAKRARTESQVDEIDVDIPVDVAPPAKPSGQALSELSGWLNAEADAAALTDYQRREFRKIVGGLKKTKAGGQFRDSVEKLWPGVWESYSHIIEKPTDLGEIDRGLRDHTLETLGAFKDNLALLYQNCVTFNGADHDVTKNAWLVVEQIWSRSREIPVEEPPKSKPAPDQGRRPVQGLGRETLARRLGELFSHH
jgi:bromodomain-containing factor 1